MKKNCVKAFPELFKRLAKPDILKVNTNNTITAIAPAKVNLYLHITGKKKTGYHELDSLIVFTELHDIISVTTHHNIEISVRGPLAGQLSESPETNLVYKAAQILTELTDIPKGAKITVSKNIPVAAGLGGGSADAAAAIQALCKLWNIGLEDRVLATIALSLGSDVPACLLSKTAQISGFGEILKPVPEFPKNLHLVLVNPGIKLLTKSVYEGFRGPFKGTKSISLFPTNPTNLPAFLQQCSNDLSESAKELCPDIIEVLDALESCTGCYLARISGSGPSCFGIFPNAKVANLAALQIARRKTDWWVKATTAASHI